MTTKTKTDVKHPAKFSPTIIDAIRELFAEQGIPKCQAYLTILDPMAGTGGVLRILDDEATRMAFGQIHTLWWLNEIEPEWAAECQHRLNYYHASGVATSHDWLRADALWGDTVDVVITSPTYGNRMADHHRQSSNDTSKRMTYKHVLGRELHPASSATMQWGVKYREFHREAWQRVWEVLKPGGLFILNVSDHIRNGRQVRAAAWHVMTCRAIGFEVVTARAVKTPRMGMGANGGARVDHEMVYVMRKP